MSIVRVQKTKNYTVMSNTHLRDKRLTLKAKGLLSVVLSLPEDWDYTIRGLCAICKENETAVKSALKELKEYGYLVVTKLNPEKGNGNFRYIYDFFENPQDIQQLENQGVENLPLENMVVNKDTEEINKKELNIDYNRIVDLYHDCCPSMPKVIKLTDARKKTIRARLKECGEDQLVSAFTRAENSDFLRNGKGTWNGANFDWIMNERNLINILEGKYDNRQPDNINTVASWLKKLKND